MTKKQFSRSVFESFIKELSEAHLEPEDRSLLVANMLSICTFNEQAQFATLLKKRGFVFNLYQNPTPVSTALVPVSTDGGIRLLAVIRNIEPARGQMGLPGGYVDKHETFEVAAAREVMEETGLNLSSEDFSLMVSRNTPLNTTLVFCTYKYIIKASDINFDFSNKETQKIVLAGPEDAFCFPSHTEVANKFWSNIHRYL